MQNKSKSWSRQSVAIYFQLRNFLHSHTPLKKIEHFAQGLTTQQSETEFTIFITSLGNKEVDGARSFHTITLIIACTWLATRLAANLTKSSLLNLQVTHTHAWHKTILPQTLSYWPFAGLSNPRRDPRCVLQHKNKSLSDPSFAPDNSVIHRTIDAAVMIPPNQTNLVKIFTRYRDNIGTRSSAIFKTLFFASPCQHASR